MLTLKKLKWDRAFSYGDNNVIDFSGSQLIQLIGKNGYGKSSIALILEEVLFNKNSKGVKKGDILNRYVKGNNYYIELEFLKDTDDYIIKSTRGSTQVVRLFKNGLDISAHTATNTYKIIEDILGIDHKTFSQIVYQSNSASLEFLTTTDTARKKFLIDLLNLSIYTKASDYFKDALKELTKDSDAIKLKISTYNSLLSKINKEDLNIQKEVVVPEDPVDNRNKLAEITEALRTILETNKRIVQNNTYKTILGQLQLIPVERPTDDIDGLKAKLFDIASSRNVLQKVIQDKNTLRDKCPSCGRPMDIEHKLVAIEEAKSKIKELEEIVAPIQDTYNKALKKLSEYNTYVNSLSEYERLHSLIDKQLQTSVLDKVSLEKDALVLKESITKTEAAISTAVRANAAVSAHNAKVEILKAQREEVLQDIKELEAVLSSMTDKMLTMQVLVKTFSTTGLVAYKIECLVKDLEEITNKYLQEISDGRFQLSFEVSDSDKLNVVIVDNGNDVDILSLSSGERARVNVATLLAIRKLLQTLSSSRINLLILDETIESLDIEGKEKLVEVLLSEEHLNTVLVSHGFSHPLLEKLSVVKENNISRIE